VPKSKGIAYFHDIHIWNIKATEAETAFDVNGNAALPVERVELENIDIHAKSAGHIANAKDWTFRRAKLSIVDGSSVALNDSTNIIGLPKGGAPSTSKAGKNSAYEE